MNHGQVNSVRFENVCPSSSGAESHSAVAAPWLSSVWGAGGEGNSLSRGPEVGKAWGAYRDVDAVRLPSERAAGSKVGWVQENEDT